MCALCNDTRGVCVTCDELGCKTQFHVGCARVQGERKQIFDEVYRSLTPIIGSFLEARPDGSNDNNILLTAYCPHHSLHHIEHYPTFPRDPEHPLGNETALVAKSMGLTEEDYDLIYRYLPSFLPPSPLS